MGREMYFQPGILSITQWKTIHHRPFHLDSHGVTIQEFSNMFGNLQIIQVEKEDDTTLGQ
jgi:hypothetical protein